MNIQNAIDSVAAGVRSFANHSASAAARANGVSAAAQAAQGQFNAGQANLANSIGSDRLAEQYQYNSAQAAMANQAAMNSWSQTANWNEMMWDKAAQWNEAMLEKQMNFNREEAQKARDWQQKMMETSYQRAVADMQKAGLNPILAVTGGGISTGSGNGSAASIGGSSMSGASMSPISTHSASGSVMNGISASEGNYTGQMEYMGGILGLLSAALGGLSTAAQAASNNGLIADVVDSFIDYMKYDPYVKDAKDVGMGRVGEYFNNKKSGPQGSTTNNNHGGMTGKVRSYRN